MVGGSEYNHHTTNFKRSAVFGGVALRDDRAVPCSCGCACGNISTTGEMSAIRKHAWLRDHDAVYRHQGASSVPAGLGLVQSAALLRRRNHDTVGHTVTRVSRARQQLYFACSIDERPKARTFFSSFPCARDRFERRYRTKFWVLLLADGLCRRHGRERLLVAVRRTRTRARAKSWFWSSSRGSPARAPFARDSAYACRSVCSSRVCVV